MLTPSIVSCGPFPKMLNFKFMVSMRLLYLRSSLLLIFSLCAFFSVTAQQAPTIVEVVPQDGAIDVPRNLNFQLTFRENITYAGLESSVFRLTDRDIGTTVDLFLAPNKTTGLQVEYRDSIGIQTNGDDIRRLHVSSDFIKLRSNTRYKIELITNHAVDANGSLLQIPANLSLNNDGYDFTTGEASHAGEVPETTHANAGWNDSWNDPFAGTGWIDPSTQQVGFHQVRKMVIVK